MEMDKLVVDIYHRVERQAIKWTPKRLPPAQKLPKAAQEGHHRELRQSCSAAERTPLVKEGVGNMALEKKELA